QDEGAATDLGAVDEARTNPEILGDIVRHVAARGEHRIDVALAQTRVRECVGGGLHVQLECRFVWQAAELIRFGNPDDGDAPAQRSSGGAHEPPAGRNFGSVISSVMSSKTTSSSMSQRTCAGSGSTPTILLNKRGPSASSTRPMITGVWTG